jgi:hypothetical protein
MNIAFYWMLVSKFYLWEKKVFSTSFVDESNQSRTNLKLNTDANNAVPVSIKEEYHSTALISNENVLAHTPFRLWIHVWMR